MSKSSHQKNRAAIPNFIAHQGLALWETREEAREDLFKVRGKLPTESTINWAEYFRRVNVGDGSHIPKLFFSWELCYSGLRIMPCASPKGTRTYVCDYTIDFPGLVVVAYTTRARRITGAIRQMYHLLHDGKHELLTRADDLSVIIGEPKNYTYKKGVSSGPFGIM